MQNVYGMTVPGLVPLAHALVKEINGTIDITWTCRNTSTTVSRRAILALLLTDFPPAGRRVTLPNISAPIPPGDELTISRPGIPVSTDWFPNIVNNVVLEFHEFLEDFTSVGKFAEHPFTVTISAAPVVEQQVVLATGENLIHGFVFARNMLWATTTTSPAKLLRFRDPLRDLSIYDVLTFPADGRHDSAAQIMYNPTMDMLHVLFSHSAATAISTVNPDTLGFSDIFIGNQRSPAWGGAVVAGNRICVLTYLSPARLFTIDPLTGLFIEGRQVSVMNRGHTLTSDGTYIYGAGDDAAFPGSVRVFRANPLSINDASFITGVIATVNATSDDTTVLAGRLWIPAELPATGMNVGLNIGDMQSWITASTGLSAGSFGVFSDGTNLWSTWNMAPGTLTANNPFDGTLLYTHTFPAGFTHTNEIAFTPDRNVMFATFWLAPARVARFLNPLPH